MKKIILYIATSLDGYIACPDHELDWLDELPNLNQTDHGYGAFISGIDTLIMGRGTYEVVIGFDVEWPYSDHTYVMTNKKDLEIKSPRTYVLSGNLPEAVEELKSKPGKDIWLVGGGLLITSFLEHDLVDEMMISMIPVVLGKGIPLFANHPPKTWFELVNTQTFETGAVNLHYRRK